MMITNDMAALVGFGCEAFFYGCYTILFALSIYLMFHGPRRGIGVNKPIFFISGLLYLSCSTHFALEFSHFYQVLNATGVNGFADETNVLIGADLLISITDFIGELILIYRCWLLWSKNYWVIILPSLISIASLVCVSEVLHLLLRINPNSPIAPPSLVPLGLAAFSLPLGTNVIVTTLIATRIWYLSPRNARNMRGAQFPSRTGQAAIDIVVESGMLYLAVQLIFVILFAIRHPAQGIVGVIAVQTYGIAPTLILIRVALGVSSNMQTGPIRSGPPSSVSHPTSSMQVRINTVSFTEPGRRLPAEMPVSDIKSKPSSGNLGSAFSSMENVAAVTV
ncbi:hypothetical protein F5888DRAFT_84798 [Russula emetica]|nr:hypothetical protein F5888DRAFT_84798 [Russula emetica]